MARVMSMLWSLLVLFTAVLSVSSKRLETVPDKELLKLVQTEKYVVALFSKDNCPSCKELEHELAMSREVLVDSLGAWVVKLISSPLVSQYSPSGEPAVVFFRNGLPMLYQGAPNEEDLLSKIQRSQESAVRELNDENFEHLTQASTGATTGDWLVMFHKPGCLESERLQAIWEAVGAELNGRVNVARVNKGTNGGATSRRFEVSDTPAFILFRHGKIYKYELDQRTISNFIDFATDFYRNSKAIDVPPPKSPFDDLIEMIVETMKDNPQVVKLGSIVFTVVLLLGILISFTRKPKPAKKTKTVKKKAA